MKVAVAVMMDRARRVLLTRRPLHKVGGGLWEFPGGKVEPDEDMDNALRREILEEVGLKVINSQLVGYVETHADTPVLCVYLVTQWQGEARCCEDQLDLRWADWKDIHQYDFPAANQKIIKMIEAL